MAHARWIRAFGVMGLLLGAGCDAPPSMPACRSSADCSGREVCVDGECRLPMETDAGTDASVGIDAPFERPDAPESDAGPVCPAMCPRGETCAGTACCAIEQACGDACCGASEVCSFDRCVAIGATCRSDDDCMTTEYCESRLGDSMMECRGEPVANGRCLARPPRCADGTLPDPESPSCVASCTFVPTPDAFDVRLRYSWGTYDGMGAEPNPDDIRNSPIVIQLDDDDCDGRITGRDRAEIVVVTSPNDTVTPQTGDLVVLSVVDGALTEKWRVAGVAHPHRYPAAGNIDGMPGNEIVIALANTMGAIQRVRAYGVDATGLVERWTATTPGACLMVSLADLDQDGTVEVICGGTVLNGADGTPRFTFDRPWSGEVLVADVDGDADHRLELVVGGRIMHLAPGATMFTTLAELPAVAGAQYPIVADLEPGGLPEIVTVYWDPHLMTVWRYDGAGGTTVLRSGLDINGPLDPVRCGATSNGRTHGGGPPTAADVNADGVPDIAVAGGVGYAVLDGALLVDPARTNAETFIWTQETVDCSSAQTGSSVFDFNADGRAEVLYADEQTFRIYAGAGAGAMTGEVLFSSCSTNGTILEMPVVADVDGNGEADIVVVSNARYRACLDDPMMRVSGVRVYGSADGRWVRTRPVWNQHGYHVTNVEADGTIPTREAPNWSTAGLNNYRQNRQPGSENGAVDAVLSLRPRCFGEASVIATVRNLGEAVLPPGTRIELFRGTAAGGSTDRVGEGTTSVGLYPAQAEDVVVPISDPALLGGTDTLYGRVTVPPEVPECRSDNNVADGLRVSCLG